MERRSSRSRRATRRRRDLTVPPPYLVLAPLAFASALALTPLSSWLARRTGMLDHPDPRKSHTQPTPLLGGAAVACSLVLAPLLARTLFGVVSPFPEPGLLVGALLSLVLGLIDDRRPMRPMGKLLGQIAAAGTLVFWGPDVPWIRHDPLALIGAILGVVALLNAVNFLDAMDGVVGAVVPIIAAGFVGIALAGNAPVDLALGWSLIGACAGFLVFNAPPARIFLGDAGSHLLGFALAALSLESLRAGPTVPHFASLLLILATPLFDVAFVTIDRTLRRRPIHVGGVDHPTHRLSRRAGAWGTLGMLSAATAVDVCAGVWLWMGENPQPAVAAVLIFGLAYALFGAYLRRIGPTP
jgi:UDP-GlcNAc:undecaprenyl-phosphate/decaprenyl-phosphate GlcNAc-1-phosphate transferase